MKKGFIKGATCCLLTSLIITGNSYTAEASSLSTETAVAGASTALDSFYSTNSSSIQSTVMSAGSTASSTLNDLVQVAASDAQIVTQPVSEYADVAISQVTNYVNIRNMPSEEGEILGKLYNNCAATILATEGDWYKIKSGSVEGYVKSEYVVSGEAAEAIAEQVGHKIAKVNTTTLKVRTEPTLDSTVETLIPIDEEYDVVETHDGWVKIQVDEDIQGYVSTEYVICRVDFEEAVSLEEEAAQIAEEEQRKQQAEEAARKLAEAKAAQKQSTSKTNSTSTSQSSESSSSESSSQTTGSSTSSATRNAIVSYALQFVGNPYVYGGTSLTNGTDCSGFTMSVFANFGIGLSRTSGGQASNGTSIDPSSAQPGDLFFYASGGGINHVALYIGNGQVVHASTPKSGIKVSSAYYRTPCKVVNVIG